MATFSISFPGGMDHVVVPSSGQICVCGNYDDSDSLGERDLLSPYPYILVRVLTGWVTPPNSPGPSLTTDGKGTIQVSSWMATNATLPLGSSGGAQITVAAWLVTGAGGSGSGAGTTRCPKFSKCYAGGNYPNGSPPKNSCVVCSGSGIMQARFVGELASALELEVTIPSGANAGAYRATAVALMTWDVTIGGVPYRLVCTEGASLTIHGPSSSAPSTSFESDPFSATFPGDIFDADDEIVVILA